MIKKVTGIIVKTQDYKESSKIIYVLTKEYGYISIIAKGARRLKSKLRSVTTTLTYGYFHIYYKEDKLSILIEVDVLDYFKQITSDLTKISYASYFCELGGQVIKQISTIEYEAVFNLLLAALFKVNENFKAETIGQILGIKMLSYLGVKPNFESCVSCGRKTDIRTVNVAQGGLLCIHCCTDEYIVQLETIKTLRLFLALDINKIAKLEIKPLVNKELNYFINTYYDQYTGLYFNSKEFMRKIKV